MTKRKATCDYYNGLRLWQEVSTSLPASRNAKECVRHVTALAGIASYRELHQKIGNHLH